MKFWFVKPAHCQFTQLYFGTKGVFNLIHHQVRSFLLSSWQPEFVSGLRRRSRIKKKNPVFFQTPSESGFFCHYFLIPNRRWLAQTHSKSQTSEQLAYTQVIQDDDDQENSHAHLPHGFERCLLSHTHSPLSQTVLAIRVRGSGLSVCSPSVWTVPDPTHFYEVHRRGSVPSQADGNPRIELPQ